MALRICISSLITDYPESHLPDSRSPEVRSGRITALKVKSACHTDPDLPLISIKQICYPESDMSCLKRLLGYTNMRKMDCKNIQRSS